MNILKKPTSRGTGLWRYRGLKKWFALVLAYYTLWASLFINVQPIYAVDFSWARFQSITINKDGSIYPPDIRVSRNGSVYTLTSDIFNSYYLNVQCDNITLDGAGHTLEGPPYAIFSTATYPDIAIVIQSNDVTVKNFNIKYFGAGIAVSGNENSFVSNIQIFQNNISNTGVFRGDSESGIWVQYSNNTQIFHNNISNNGVNDYYNSGILVQHSANIRIFQNNITGNYNGGIRLDTRKSGGLPINDVNRVKIEQNNIAGNGVGIWLDSSDTQIIQNNITENSNSGVVAGGGANTFLGNYFLNNGVGIGIVSWDNLIVGNMFRNNDGFAVTLGGGQNNTFYLNDFIDNKGLNLQVSNPWWNGPETNIWDSGSMGNYWSDYFSRYPNATSLDGSGIGDTPFFINPNNIDRYPLTEPYSIIMPITSLSPSPTSTASPSTSPSPSPSPTPSVSQQPTTSPRPSASSISTTEIALVIVTVVVAVSVAAVAISKRRKRQA